MLALPADHALRIELNNEVHARPPDPLSAPVTITYLALVCDPDTRKADWTQVRDLARGFGVDTPERQPPHIALNLGAVRITVESHTEFVRYSIISKPSDDKPFSSADLSGIPRDWTTRLTGQVLVATKVLMLPRPAGADDIEALSQRYFAGNAIIGARIGGGIASAFTDFRIHADGFGRVLVHDAGMPPRQAGRMIQRLLEVDTYRMMALLALPVARALWPHIAGYEKELAELTTQIADGGSDEPTRLERLTRLEAEVQRRYAEHHYRLSASAAYYELVQRRIDDLREQRIEGVQTFREFTERRLAPAMSTCRTVAGNVDALSQRIARTTQLLSTRVDIVREQQNRALLETMARRAKLQLRLQQTVEGLSVAAISYYIVGLIGYFAKAVKGIGIGINPDLVTGLSIPVVIALLIFGVRRLRQHLKVDETIKAVGSWIGRDKPPPG